VSRKKFIESQGATCDNWYWSWSFVNVKEKFVIFGAWDTNTEGDKSLILSESWRSRKGRKNNGFAQSLEHVGLIFENGYDLYIFPIIHFPEKDKDRFDGPAKIKSFIKVLTKKSLYKEGDNWYATDLGIESNFPNDVSQQESYEEGSVKSVTVNAYERNPEARDACIKYHGVVCAVCDFDFKTTYGEIGAGYIHVHHIKPLHEIRRSYIVDPKKDLIPVCPNCHAMIHRNKNPLSIRELKAQISRARGS